MFATNLSAAPLQTISSSSFYRYLANQALHSFPPRRSSDLTYFITICCDGRTQYLASASLAHTVMQTLLECSARHSFLLDRKSTRLNSSHTVISYAVFCSKKKSAKQP